MLNIYNNVYHLYFFNKGFVFKARYVICIKILKLGRDTSRSTTMSW